MEKAGEYLKSMVEYAESFRDVMDSIDDQMFEIAEKWKDLSSFEFVASGTDMATAWFGSAKVYEASGDVATYENIEDWCHVNYFAQNPEKIGTVVVLDKDSPRHRKDAAHDKYHGGDWPADSCCHRCR